MPQQPREPLLQQSLGGPVDAAAASGHVFRTPREKPQALVGLVHE